MDTLLDYLCDQKASFDEVPLNPIDSLIFSSLAYFNWETCPLMEFRQAERINLAEAMRASRQAEMIAGNWLADWDESMPFWERILESPRFADASIAFYVDECVATVEKQFSAITFFLPNAQAYIAFRGTDGTLAGWKEDFNLSFKEVIPSQRSAASYVSGVASSCREELYVGGHSKGGNLAEFSALTVDESIYKRLVGVFNHDGPSFLSDPSPRMEKADFQKKFCKYVPASSVFGMILERRTDYRVVSSTAFAFLQHAPFTWGVEGNDFIYEPGIDPAAGFFDDNLNAWFLSIDASERERFIDTVYEVLTKTDAKTWADFNATLPKNIKTLLIEGKNLDSETQRFLFRTVASIGRVIGSDAAQRLRNQLPLMLPARLSSMPKDISAKLKDAGAGFDLNGLQRVLAPPHVNQGKEAGKGHDEI